MTNNQGALLIVAGSDPSGGAGIQADLKTATTIGVYGAAAITSLTVQNTEGVASTNPVDPALVKNQIEKVLTDLPITHIKIGMLGNGEITKTVGEILSRFKGISVCDPVLSSSSGVPLLEDSSIAELRKNIITHATAITPNFLELAALSGRDISSDDDMRYAVERLFTKHPSLKVIAVKGGHRKEDSSEISDFLFQNEGSEIIENNSTRERLITKNNHGTGCTFASALTSYHMVTREWPLSFQMAGEYLQQLIEKSADIPFGHGTGPLQHHLYTADKNPS